MDQREAFHQGGDVDFQYAAPLSLLIYPSPLLQWCSCPPNTWKIEPKIDLTSFECKSEHKSSKYLKNKHNMQVDDTADRSKSVLEIVCVDFIIIK